MDVVQVLCKKYSNYLWKINDNYESLEWNQENGIPKPTMEELHNAWIEMNSEKPYEKLRQKRNALLSETDFMFTTDYPMSPELKEKWSVYRQTLRDLPETSTPMLDENENLIHVIFPNKP